MKNPPDREAVLPKVEATEGRVWIWAVVPVALAASALLFAYLLTVEAGFFRAHTAQKTRILRVPAELAAFDEKLVREQRQLIAVQNEIKSKAERH